MDASAGAPATEHLSSRELRWYALGFAPVGINILGWNYLVFYYNQVIGLPAAAIGVAAVFVSVFDAVTDPAVGILSDRTRSRWGRRHPYLFFVAIPYALGFYLIWALPPGLSVQALMAWLLVLHLAKRLLDTLHGVPYLALGAEISSDYEERTRLATARSFSFNFGRAGAGALLLLVFLRSTPEYPNGQLNPDGYVGFGALMALVMFAAIAASAWRTRHWIPRLSTAAPREERPLAEVFAELRQVFAYRSFRAVLGASVSRHLAWGMSDTLGIFMATFFWQIPTETLFLWGVGMFGGIFLGLPFWRRMAARFGKRPVAISGDLTYLTFFCTPYLLKILGFWPDPSSDWYVPLYILTTGFVAHFGIAATGVMVGSMLGDITDQDELEHGSRREGLILGAESFAWKALTGLGPLAAGLVIDGVGLSEKARPEEVPADVVQALGLAQGGLMVVFFALSIFLIRRYDLDRARHAGILDALRERRDSSG